MMMLEDQTSCVSPKSAQDVINDMHVQLTSPATDTLPVLMIERRPAPVYHPDHCKRPRTMLAKHTFNTNDQMQESTRKLQHAPSAQINDPMATTGGWQTEEYLHYPYNLNAKQTSSITQ